MNLDQLQQKLIAAARAHPPDDRVPYAFEKRIMARLASPLSPDAWSLWARALWRAAAPCVALTLLLGAWTFFSPAANVAPENFSLSQDFEQTLLVAVDQFNETW